MINVLEFTFIQELSVLVETFLKWLELVAKLPDELLEERTNVQFCSIILMRLQDGQDHLDKTVGAESAGERLVQIFEAEELLEDKS